MPVEAAEESRLRAVLSLTCAVERAPGSTLVPKASVAGSRPEVQTEVTRGGGEDALSRVVGATGDGEAVLGADCTEEELLVSSKGGRVLDTCSGPLLPGVVTGECVKP